MNKVYSRIDWKNYPSLDTPLNEANLNKMDSAVDELDNRIIGMDTAKVSNEDIQNLITSWTMDEKTGVITITKVDGSKDIFDLNIEKIPVSFILREDGILTMITDDGTVFTANIGSMIPILTFSNSDTIAVSVTGEGINKTYTFSIKNNSVTDDMIEANYLANIKIETEKSAKNVEDSKNYSDLSKSYAVGTDNIVREGDSTDNAKSYAEDAKRYRDEAQAIVGVDVMVGATDDEDGKSGLVPIPYAGDNKKFLTGAGTYEEVNMEEKANGKGISFSVENGVLFCSFEIE